VYVIPDPLDWASREAVDHSPPPQAQQGKRSRTTTRINNIVKLSQ